MLCDKCHMSLHQPKNKSKNEWKRKIKSRKIDKKKRKSKSNIKVQAYYDTLEIVVQISQWMVLRSIIVTMWNKKKIRIVALIKATCCL